MLCKLCPDCIWNNGSTERSVNPCDDRSRSCRHLSKSTIIKRMQAERHEWALKHSGWKPMTRKEAFMAAMQGLAKNLGNCDFDKLLSRL